MKTVTRLGSFLAALFVLSFLIACQSTPPIDWGSRIGAYSYDDSVIELGPPDRMTLISTGRVAEWVTGHDRAPTFSFGVGSYGRSGGVGVGTSTGGDLTEKLLRLTFDDRDQLVTWENTKR